MDLENKQWTTSSPESKLERYNKDETSDIYVNESQNHTKNYKY